MILVTGGAGYIGSHVCKTLLKQGYEVLVIDDLSTGHRELLKCNTFVNCNVGDIKILQSVFRSHKIDAVIHLAAKSIVSESNKKIDKYFIDNVVNTANLLEIMSLFGVNKIVYSSSAAVYGIPYCIPIDESQETCPINFYGQTKLMTEDLLEWYRKCKGINYIALRYFNAAGASPDGDIGEWHEPETHLIPNAIRKILSHEPVDVYGHDYSTKDKTCVRDYVHVDDLADAHILAIQALDKNKSECINIGYGKGYSVLQIIEEICKLLDVDVTIRLKERREGDPDALIASNTLAKQYLHWQPKYDDLKFIIQTAINWELKLQKVKNSIYKNDKV